MASVVQTVKIGEKEYKARKLNLGNFRAQEQNITKAATMKKGVRPTAEQILAVRDIAVAAIAQCTENGIERQKFEEEIDALDYSDAFSQLVDAYTIGITGRLPEPTPADEEAPAASGESQGP